MTKTKRVRLLFAWYDFWVGLFWDRKKCALYIFPIPMFGLRIRFFGHHCWVMRKRGLFYRPNGCGYTDRIEDSGRYTKSEAIQIEYPHDEDRVTKHHISEFL